MKIKVMDSTKTIEHKMNKIFAYTSTISENLICHKNFT